MLRPLGIKSKWVNYPVDAAALFFAVLGLLKLATLFDYRIPVEVHFRVIKDLSIHAGEPFQYENYFTRQKFCTTRVDRWFIGSDKVIRSIDPVNSGMPTEGLNVRQQSTASIKVPPNMPPGRAESCFKARWVCDVVAIGPIEVGGRVLMDQHLLGPQTIWPIEGPETCLDFIVAESPANLSLWLYPTPPQSISTSVAMEGEP